MNANDFYPKEINSLEQAPRSVLTIQWAQDNSGHGEDVFRADTQGRDKAVLCVFDGASGVRGGYGHGKGLAATQAANDYLPGELSRFFSDGKPLNPVEYQEYADQKLVETNRKVLQTEGSTTATILHFIGRDPGNPENLLACITVFDDSPLVYFDFKNRKFVRFPTPRNDNEKYAQRFLDSFATSPSQQPDISLFEGRNRIRNFLGHQIETSCFTQIVSVPPNTTWLVCSDGISDVLPLIPTEGSHKLRMPSIYEMLEEGRSAEDVLREASRWQKEPRNPRRKNPKDDSTIIIARFAPESNQPSDKRNWSIKSLLKR